MSAALPDFVVRQLLVREAGEAEAAVGNADPAILIGHDLGCDVGQRALFRLQHQAGALAAMRQDQSPCAAVGLVHHIPLP